MMIVHKFSFNAILFVVQLIVGLKEVTATQCTTEARMLSSGQLYNSFKHLTIFPGNLTTLISPSCLVESLPLGGNPSLNISATVSIPSAIFTHLNIHVFLSGNITGNGSVLITDRYGVVLLNTNRESSRDFVIWPGNVFNIIYTTSRWLAGDGPLVELYAGFVSGYCSATWRKCEVNVEHQYTCLPLNWKCNGRSECQSGVDESDCLGCCAQRDRYSYCKSPTNCGCSNYLTTQRPYTDGECHGISKTISLATQSNQHVNIPQFPQAIPYDVTYFWRPVSASTMVLTFDSFVVTPGDTITLSSGDYLHHLESKKFDVSKPITMKSLSANVRLRIVMRSANSRYNFTSVFTNSSTPPPQISSEVAAPKGASECDPLSLYVRHCHSNNLCVRPQQICDEYMDCPNGRDELGCGSSINKCKKDEILCPGSSPTRCFTMAQRCDGSRQCTSSGYDEKNCDDTLCGTHNGTFLCTDKTCIFEAWLCDKAKDCPDGADEQNCDGTTLKVVTASVIGSLVCAIMMVIAIGCFCKLHAHRMYENLNQRSRYESPMTRITNELMRRAAPPPYAEAMQRSRPFEEVQNEYLAALEQRRREETHEENEEEIHEEQRSMASASGTIDPLEGSLVEVADESTVSFRRNPNKPSETAQPEQHPGGCTNAALEPKSDDETGDVPQTPSLANETPSGTQTRRHALRRNSADSDVSLLSRDSDDVPLLS